MRPVNVRFVIQITALYVIGNHEKKKNKIKTYIHVEYLYSKYPSPAHKYATADISITII